MGEAAPCGEASALGKQTHPPPFPPAGPDGTGGEERDPRSSLPPPRGSAGAWISFHTKDMWGGALPTRRFGAIR